MNVEEAKEYVSKSRIAFEKNMLKQSKMLAVEGRKKLMENIESWKKDQAGREERGTGVEKDGKMEEEASGDGKEKEDSAGEVTEEPVGTKDEEGVKERLEASDPGKGTVAEKEKEDEESEDIEEIKPFEEIDGDGEDRAEIIESVMHTIEDGRAEGEQEAIEAAETDLIEEAEAKEREAREAEAREREAREKEALETEAREKEALETEAREREALETEAREREALREQAVREEAKKAITDLKDAIKAAMKRTSLTEEREAYGQIKDQYNRKEYQLVMDGSGKVLASITEKLEALDLRRKEVRARIIELQEHLAGLEDKGVDVGETWELYELLSNKYHGEDYEDTDAIIDKIIEGSNIWKDYDATLLSLLKARKEISVIMAEGIDVSVLIERFEATQEMLHEREYTGLQEALEGIKAEGESLVMRHRETQTRKEIDFVRTVIKEAEEAGETGEVWEEVRDTIEQAKSALDDKDYESANTLAHDARDRLYPDYYRLLLTRLKELMIEAQERDMELSTAQERIIRSQSLVDEGGYADAVEEVKQAERGVNDAIEYDKCVEELTTLRADLEEMSKDGFDILDTHSTMLAARQNLEEGNFEKVRSIIERCRHMARDIERIGAIKRIIYKVRENLEELGDAGMDVSDLRDELDEINRLAEEDDERAREQLKPLSTSVEELHEAYPPVITLIQRSQYYLSKMTEYECNTDEVEGLFNGLTDAFEKRELVRARDLGDECAGISQRSLEDFITASTLLHESANLMESVRNMGADTEELEANIRKSYEALDGGKFSDGLAMAQNNLDDTRSMKRNFQRMLGAIQVAQSKINIAKNLGANVEEPMKFFRLIKESLDANDYEAAEKNIELAHKAAEGINSGYRKTADHIQKAQELIFTLKDRGAVLRKAERMFNDLIPLLDTNDFENATDLARNCIREAEVVERKFDYLMELIDIAQNRMTEAKQRGTNVSSIVATFKEIGRYMDEGEYDEAQKRADGVIDTIENLTKLHDESIRLLRLTWAKLSDAKAIGTDSTTAEDMLEEARNNLGDGDYQKAIDLAKDSASELMDQLKRI